MEFAKDIRGALAHTLTSFEVDLYLPMIAKINRLKKEKNAIILVHHYQVPEIYHGIADFRGDSLGLSREAAKVKCERIIFCGVHFMAETAKLLNPHCKVLIPDLDAGCSLSESITVENVRALKAAHPGVPVVCYVNTTAAIKAESDVCCTSSNAAKIVQRLPGDSVIFIPDEYLGKNVAIETKKKVITHPGRCMVHEQFTVEDLKAYRAQYPGMKIMAHPECHPDVVQYADYSGSTSGMLEFVGKSSEKKWMLVTECGMSDNIRALHPEKDFTTPCTICPHMKKITLEKVLHSLETDLYEVVIPEAVAVRARRSVEKMLELTA